MSERLANERPIRPYRSRKHETAKQVLTEEYGPSAQYYGDRAWCYAKLAELGYWWDVAALVWVAGKLTGS